MDESGEKEASSCSQFMSLRPTDRIVDTAMSRARNQINQWQITDFIKHYLQCTPLFYAEIAIDYDNTYMGLTQSIVRVCELLIFQFRRSVHVKSFLQICYNVITIAVNTFFWVNRNHLCLVSGKKKAVNTFFG